MFDWFFNWLNGIFDLKMNKEVRAILLYLYHNPNSSGAQITTHMGLGFGAYPTLHRLDSNGYVASTLSNEPTIIKGAKRIYYSLTPQGKEWVESNMMGPLVVEHYMQT